jgi:hypothetical protein
VVAVNEYLANHPRANPDTQVKNLESRAAKLRVSGWTTFDLEGRVITIGKDPEALAEASKLDGCYVLKTGLSQTAASKDIVHGRYKDLTLVEWAFRESKTMHLEIRPVNVRLETDPRPCIRRHAGVQYHPRHGSVGKKDFVQAEGARLIRVWAGSEQCMQNRRARKRSERC